MYFEEKAFYEALDLLAENCSKQPPSMKLKAFYFKHLNKVSDGSLKQAFSIFAMRGVWPSVEMILKECGGSTPLSHTEIAAIQKREEEEYRQRERNKAARGEQNEAQGDTFNDAKIGDTCAFQSIFEGDYNSQAADKFTAMRSRLEAAGWNVDRENEYKGLVREKLVGRGKIDQPLCKTIFFCTRVSVPKPALTAIQREF